MRILDGEAVVRAWGVEGAEAVYLHDTLDGDFPGGLTPGVSVGVAQWSALFGWGVEARVLLV